MYYKMAIQKMVEKIFFSLTEIWTTVPKTSSWPIDQLSHAIAPLWDLFQFSDNNCSELSSSLGLLSTGGTNIQIFKHLGVLDQI
jgi:hypothetical protein